MIVINNTLLPFKGYKAINLFGIILFRKGHKLDRVIINHERIHTAQMLEMLFAHQHRQSPVQMIACHSLHKSDMGKRFGICCHFALEWMQRYKLFSIFPRV